MKKISVIFTLFTATSLFSLQSCSSCSGKHRKDDKDSVFAKGKVIPVVVCKKDYSQSYSLYLPSNYSEEKKWAIFYAFDSHGKGLIPVELFKDEAEKYGYIIVGSNNSKNGTPLSATNDIYDTLYSDTHRRFSIDDSRIYTAGFSGGSRVAATIAASKGNINSVIGCSAGFQPGQSSSEFGYFGIAGKADMNMNEMLTLDDILEQTGYRHYLSIFDGKHEWPPKEVVSDAFLWLELKAMKDKQKPANDTLIKNKIKAWENDYKRLLEKEKNSYDAYLLCKKTICFFDGLAEVSFFKNELATLEKNSSVTLAKKHLKEISEKELKLQSYYLPAISAQTTDWWKTQVTKTDQIIKTTADAEEKFMYKRVMSYVSLATYMNLSSLMKSSQYDEAAKYNIIYELVDPENPEHFYISAALAMKKGKQEDALANLEKAAEIGFDDAGRLESDTVMAPLKQDEKFRKISEKIKANITEKK